MPSTPAVSRAWAITLGGCLTAAAVGAIGSAMAGSGVPLLAALVVFAAWTAVWGITATFRGLRPAATRPPSSSDGATAEAPPPPIPQPAVSRPLRDGTELLGSLSRVQAQFISEPDADRTFERLLDDLLRLTGSRYGFIAEVMTPPTGSAFVEYRAIRNVSWTPCAEDPSVTTYSAPTSTQSESELASNRPSSAMASSGGVAAA